jgi:hypothetical protein
MTPPQTFYDCLAFALWLLYLLGQGGGGTMAGPLPDSNTLNVRRVAGGGAGLAVFSFVMVSAANDVHGFGPLFRFLAQLPFHYNALAWPWIVLPSVGMVGLLGVASVFRLLAGIAGQKPPRHIAGGDFLWLVAAGGVWAWGGLFLDEKTSWFDDHWVHVWNFGLTGVLLFAVVNAVLSIAVRLRGAGRRRKGPAPYPMPRGRAGDASRQQARDALRSDGGRKLPADEERF